MIFSLNSRLLQTKFFEITFTTSEGDQFTPLLAIHVDDLETWTDGSYVLLSPVSLHWEFFTGLGDTLDIKTYTILYRFRCSIMLFHFNERLVETNSMEKFFTTTPTVELKPCIILHHAYWETGRTYLTSDIFNDVFGFLPRSYRPRRPFSVQLNSLIQKLSPL